MTISIVNGVNPLQTTLLELGIVSIRVAVLLRCAEIQPGFGRFVLNGLSIHPLSIPPLICYLGSLHSFQPTPFKRPSPSDAPLLKHVALHSLGDWSIAFVHERYIASYALCCLLATWVAGAQYCSQITQGTHLHSPRICNLGCFSTAGHRAHISLRHNHSPEIATWGLAHFHKPLQTQVPSLVSLCLVSLFI
jgi:hypothetical protein